MMTEEPRASNDERIERLTRRTADDVSKLAHEYAGVAKDELAAAGERAAWPSAVAALGGLLAIVGVGMLVASPAVPPSQRRLKRRVRFIALSYCIVGATGGLVGVGALIAAARRALPRTRHNLAEAVDVVRERL